MKVCFASSNQGKIDEINNLMPAGIEVFGLDELDISEDIPETGNSFHENARQKAEYVFERFQVPVFADDSGLCVSSLNNEPGVFSARYAGEPKDDKKNIQLLLEKLGNDQERMAEFKTVISFIDSNGANRYFEGAIAGKITTEERGENGFGYDPVFVPDGYEETFAQLPKEVKNKISHRALAVKKLINYLSSTL